MTSALSVFTLPARARRLRTGLLLLGVALLAACAQTGHYKTLEGDPSDYIDTAEYDRLKLVSTQPGIRIYRYQAPDRRGAMKSMMVDPIVLYQADTTSKPGPNDALYRLRNSMDISTRQLVRKQFGISYKPGQQVARLSTALTGVLLDGNEFKPRQLVPVATVLKTAANGSSTLNGKNLYLMVEAKITDSQSGKLMGEGVYLVASEQFRREAATPEQFQQSASQWVRGAVSVASGLR